MKSSFGILVVVPLIISIVETWVVMIGVGVVHAQVLPAVIPAGYGALFFPCLLFTFISYYCTFLKEILS